MRIILLNSLCFSLNPSPKYFIIYPHTNYYLTFEVRELFDTSFIKFTLLSLEESVRLLLEYRNSPRDHCIITIFLNCALRLSELASLNIDQVNNDILSVVGKGNKERKIFLTPAAKKAINNWLHIRNSIKISDNALFISRNNNRITARAIQNIVKKNMLFLLVLTQNLYQLTNFSIQQQHLCISMVD
ncbi:tyrosine-type recombinase/integrase [Clostridium thailandense]|uniref:tyrosine-type recombinase/integrase n=1 Tax=Clostridium thailandense TaxID=2794346 RepID=UPI0028B229DC|nr:tyrosine-type recombinase/integrase [Clostridium thailandense]